MKRTIQICILALLMVGCSGIQLSDSSSHGIATVEVTFNALLPKNHPAGEGLLFNIIDDVTGLDFNVQLFEMDSSGENSASVTISVPIGTIVKYRYSRVDVDGNVNEIGANGEPIAYRAYLVDGPGHIAHDMIAAWGDLPQTFDTGQISGTITDAATGSPLADIMVIAAGQQTRTSDSGQFLIPGLPQGLHNILIMSPSGNHLPFQQGALVATESDTPASIALTPNLTSNVTFTFVPPAEHTANTPVFMTGNLTIFEHQPLMIAQADGSYSLTLQLPSGVDIRYKYTLGDGFWNAERKGDGNFELRQLVIPAGTTSLQVNDSMQSWSAGSSAPIWFDLTSPDNGSLVYIQFKLIDWTTPLPMWPLGSGRWAYKLYSPTNFASALEYRYCLDADCTILEASPGQPRSVAGNKNELQTIEDVIDSWQQ